MPNSHTIHVPMYMNITDLYALCMQDLKDTHQHIQALPSYSTFHGVLKKHFQHVKFPKRTRLGQCDVCTQTAARRQKCRNAQERNQLKADIAAHNELVYQERLSFMERCELSRAFVNKYMHISMDCPDMVL